MKLTAEDAEERGGKDSVAMPISLSFPLCVLRVLRGERRKEAVPCA
jgi:transcriptional regulator of met regulon